MNETTDSSSNMVIKDNDKLPDADLLLNSKKYIETTYVIKPYIPNIHQLLFRQIENKKNDNSEITLDFLKILLEQSNDPNERDSLGRTALDYAIEIGHTLAADYLRSIGAKTTKELESE